jgi:competence protein ComEC
MLKIHFLNVGKGNSTILEFPSKRLAMIDIDNSRISDDEEVLTDPIEYFQSNFKNGELFRFILTHPDMDHMSGLDELANEVPIWNFWDTKHNKTFSEEDWEGSLYNKKDWERYLKFRTSSKEPKQLELERGQTSECCWDQDGIEIMSPSSSLIKLSADASENEPEKYNHLSYVLMVKYAGRKVLLSGDASIDAWEEILNECGEKSLKADVFLAPHHGSKNNIHKEAFEAIEPDYVIVSVAEKVDYAYDYYKQLAKKQVLSTKFYGTIRVEIKDTGEYLPIYVERNV